MEGKKSLNGHFGSYEQPRAGISVSHPVSMCYYSEIYVVYAIPWCIARSAATTGRDTLSTLRIFSLPLPLFLFLPSVSSLCTSTFPRCTSTHHPLSLLAFLQSLAFPTNSYNYVHVPIHNPPCCPRLPQPSLQSHFSASLPLSTYLSAEQSAPLRVVRFPAMFASDTASTSFYLASLVLFWLSLLSILSSPRHHLDHLALGTKNDTGREKVSATLASTTTIPKSKRYILYQGFSKLSG